MPKFPATRPTLKTGALAYFETVRNGLVPCKVLRVFRDELGNVGVDLRVTGYKNRVYPCGSTIETTPTRAIPREAVYKPRGGYFPRVLPYDVQAE